MAVDALKVILGGFIAIILGIVFLQVMADQQAANTTLSKINETVAIDANGAGKLANADVHSISFFGNRTNTTDGPQINLGTHVNLTNFNGSINVGTNITGATDANQQIFSPGNYKAVYTYEGSLYVSDPESRTLLKLTVLFFVFVLVAIGIILMRDTSDNFNFNFK